MPDREKVIKGLEHCTNGRNGCFECPYSEDGFSATIYCKLQIDRDALAMLKEQEAVVRCIDCKHGSLWSDENVIVCDKLSKTRDKNWFCADGERK